MTQEPVSVQEKETLKQLKEQIKEAIKKMKEELPYIGNFRDALNEQMENAWAYLKRWDRLDEKRIGRCVLDNFEGSEYSIHIVTENAIYFFRLKCDVYYSMNEFNSRLVLLDVRNIKLKYLGKIRLSNQEKN